MPRLVTLLAVAAVGFLASSAAAQTNSLFGNRGPLSQPGQGINTGGGLSTGAAGAGVGRAGMGGTGGGIQQGGPQIATELGNVSQQVGQGGFIGRGDAAGFIGGGMANAQTTGGQFGTGGNFRGGTSSTFRGGGAGNQPQPDRQAGRGQDSTRLGTFRPTQRIAFDYVAPPRTTVSRTVRTRFDRLATRRPELADVNVALGDDGAATLTGAVPSESAARLAVALIRLEPGVRSVRTELVVPEEPTDAR